MVKSPSPTSPPKEKFKGGLTANGSCLDLSAEEDPKEGEKENESSGKVGENLGEGSDISVVPVIPPGSIMKEHNQKKIAGLILAIYL